MTIYNTVYKITNKKNNKIYVGVHKTEDPNDGYMGSSKVLNDSMAKHGDENFSKEILSLHVSYKDALAEEARIVDEAFVNRKDTYNLRTGGRSGILSEESKERMRGNTNWLGKRHTKESIEKMRAAATGRIHTKETIEKMRAAATGNTNARGKTRSKESIEKMRAAATGRIHTKESIEKMRGNTNGRGKTRSKESIEKMRVTHKNRPKIECPHCREHFCHAMYARWHGPKCKQNPDNI